MNSAETRKVVTGNRLRDGIPIYFTGAGRWSPDVNDALHVEAAGADGLLADALAGPRPHPIVAPYLIDTVAADGAIRPTTLRERIRAFGPTVLPVAG